MTGYDRRQLAQAERLLAAALQQVRFARARLDDELDVSLRCMWATQMAEEAARILARMTRRLDHRRRAAS